MLKGLKIPTGKLKDLKNDNAKSLQKRILKQEHKIYPKALKMILN